MPTVGVFSLLPVPGLVGRLAVYARALTVHGATVHRILCDGGQPRCATDTFLPALPNRFGHCPGCFASNRWLLALGDPGTEGILTLQSLIDPEAQKAVLAEIATLPDEALQAWTWQGHPCGQWLDNSLRSDYRGLRWRQMPNWADAARDWLGTMVTAMLAAEGYIRRFRPDALLIPNGRLAAERGVWAVAAAHGIPVYTEDTGLRPGHFVIRRHSPACDYDFSPEWAQWADVPLTADEEAHLDTLLAQWLNPGSEEAYAYSPEPSGDLQHVRQTLGLRDERPVVTVFPGMLNDTSLYGADRIYASQIAWMDGVIDLAGQRPDWDVVIRLHPGAAATHMWHQGRTVPIPDAWPDILPETWPTLPPNVRVIASDSPISSHDLLAVSRLVLTYVSTIGTEATLRGLPVILAGWPSYAQVGYTWNLTAPDDLLPLADRLMAKPEQPGNAIVMARRYVYLAYVRGQYDFRFFNAPERSWDLPGEMATFAKLAAEQAGDLKRLCDAILGRRPVVDPPPGKPPLLPEAVPDRERDPGALRPIGRLTVAVAIPDDNGFPVDWAAWAQVADTMLVVTGPQSRPPSGLPTTARLVAAPAGDLATCWQTALATTDTDWVLLLQAGESLATDPEDLLAVTRLQPLSPAIGLAAMRVNGVPEATCWEPRLLSRGDWRCHGKAWPSLTDAAAGRNLGDRAFLMPAVTIRSRMTLPARIAAHRAIAWLRSGLEAKPDSLVWQQALAAALRPHYPTAASRHERQANDRLMAPVRLSIAILVTADNSLSRQVLDRVDALADELLIVIPPTTVVPTGLVASYAGRLIEAADAYPDSLSAAARREAQGTWLLTLGAGEMLAPGSAEALATWLQTVDAITTGAMITCQDWPRTGIAPVRRVEQRLWRQAPGSHPPAVPSLVPGVAVWQPARETSDAATSPFPAIPAPPPATLLPAVLRLMQGDLAGARSDLLSWRRLAPVQDPDRETCDEWLITTALALGDWPLALSLADTVLSSGCQRPVLAIQAATVLQVVGDARGAAYACQQAVAARQEWRQGPSEIDWQPELILASLMLGADGPTTAAAWLSQRSPLGPLPVMQSLLDMITGQAAALPEAGVLELAAELADGGWLRDIERNRLQQTYVSFRPVGD